MNAYWNTVYNETLFCIFHTTAVPPMPGEAPPKEIDPSTLTPILNNEEGFYQIGPADSCGESFVISVTIAFAANLSQVIKKQDHILRKLHQHLPDCPGQVKVRFGQSFRKTKK